MAALARLGGWVGIHFVPENHVVAVRRFGMYDRSVGPGFVWIIPFVERVTPPIDVGMRFLDATVEGVLTKDAISTTFALSLLYQFDPRLAPRPTAAELVCIPPYELRDIVVDKMDNCLRRIVARFEVEQLCEGETTLRIQQELTRSLAAELRHLGLGLARRETVRIKQIGLPDDLLQAVLETKRHRLVLELLKQYGDTNLDTAVITELASNAAVQDGVLPLLLLADRLGLSEAAKGNGHPVD